MSIVQICNRGLTTYLGEGRITSLSDQTSAGEQCNIHYEDTLEELLVAFPWWFATDRVTLASVTNDRPSEWVYKYERPSSALAVQWVNDPHVAGALIASGQDPKAPHLAEGQNLFSNVPAAVCSFTTLISDTTRFPMYFKNALSAAIAAKVALPITQDIKRAQNAMQAADRLLDEAMVRATDENPPQQYEPMPAYLAARGLS